MNLKQAYKDWRHRRFLKKHNLTQRQFDLRYDPDYDARGNRVRRDIFHGYPFVFRYPSSNSDLLPYPGLGWNVDRVDEMKEWCETNCRGKWRNNWHRVLEDVWYDNEWEVNEIAGGDIMFFGFKDSQDAMMFTLRWAG